MTSVKPPPRKIRTSILGCLLLQNTTYRAHALKWPCVEMSWLVPEARSEQFSWLQLLPWCPSKDHGLPGKLFISAYRVQRIETIRLLFQHHSTSWRYFQKSSPVTTCDQLTHGRILRHNVYPDWR